MVILRKQGKAVRQFILENVETHPADIVTFAAQHFEVSRQAVNKHIKNLVEQGALIVSGKTKDRHYVLASLKTEQFTYTLDGNLKEDVVWSKDIRPLLSELPENVLRIWQHGITEMLNNAIDHSEGSVVAISVHKTAITSVVIIKDDGVGIFKKIKRDLNLEDVKHALLELSKGKFTTDPKHHSGEGIFFSSRMFDDFMIVDEDIVFRHKFVNPTDVVWQHRLFSGNGTMVSMKIRNHSSRTVNQVFGEFQNDDLRFSKTVVPVWLAEYGSDKLVSRSQGKRLMAGMEKFEIVVLDFDNVDFIGQGFADEVFRVFARQHPQIAIEAVNTNKEVENMIRRVTQ
jgi:anti-sigma regulatory factor (Ser/Thr protein kinase)